MLDQLEKYLQNLAPDGIALAFSGGVDSTLLLAVLAKLHQAQQFPLTILTMHTVLQSAQEIAEAKELAAKFGLRHEVFSFTPFSVDEVCNNRIDRCYHCKKAIFSKFTDYAAKHHLKYLIDGTNADDLDVYRPGRKALKELGVISPLAELGISKKQIRQISAELGLPTASKPSVPCMATRFAYNTHLDDQAIQRATDGETLIRRMFPQIKDIRLRIHGSLVRLEVSKEQISSVCDKAQDIVDGFKKLGFDYITLDLEGFRSGSFDIRLPQP